jgi:hypothetical protein
MSIMPNKFKWRTYEQGYDQALAGTKYSNPYENVDGEEADAEDFERGFNNGIELFEETE